MPSLNCDPEERLPEERLTEEHLLGEQSPGEQCPEDTDRAFMEQALAEAAKAAEEGETPIGCVIVRDGAVIGIGRNRRNTRRNPLAHAEIEAINQAAGLVEDWRLEDCTLYVTLEPCPMCAGAIVQARIPRVVIGAMNPKAGCAGSVTDLLREEGFNHQCLVETGVREEESRRLLQDFFGELRKQKDRELSEMTSEERDTLFPVTLVPRRKEWNQWFQKEKKKMLRILPPEGEPELHHIGSTAIRKIRSRNIVDILAELKDPGSVTAARESLIREGWAELPEENIPQAERSGSDCCLGKGYTKKGYADPVYHVYLRVRGDEAEILFRDYLNHHPTAAKKYEALKLSLSEAYSRDRAGYARAKTEFVRDILVKAEAEAAAEAAAGAASESASENAAENVAKVPAE